MSAGRTPREVLFKMLRDFASQHKDSPQIQRAIEGLAGKIKSDEGALIALLAWKVGCFQGGIELATHWQRPLLLGVDIIEGGKGAAVKRHGTPAEREAKREAYRVSYAIHAADLPEAGRTVLCGIVAEEFGVTAHTIAKWVLNPAPTRKGRPRKH